MIFEIEYLSTLGINIRRAEGFVNHLANQGHDPYTELKPFFNTPKILDRYDHDSLKSLIQCFIKEDDETVIKEIYKYA
jgi:hypothetical protein